ncbi:MAG: hypothetical protein ACTJFR_02245 [Canibacter sp.]
MSTNRPAAEDPDQPIGFRWRDLFPESHPERRRTPRERDLLLTTSVLHVLAAWVAAFFGRFIGMGGQTTSSVDYYLSLLLFVGVMGPFIICAATLWWSVKRFRRKQIAWPIPLYGCAALAINLGLCLLLAGL